MFIESRTQIVIHYITRALLLGSIAWAVALLYAGATMQEGTAHRVVALGPLIINHFDKIPLHEGGYTLRIGFDPGFAWYGIACFSAGVLLSAARIYQTRRH